MGFTKEILFTEVGGVGRVFIGGEQVWDQAEIKAFFELVIAQLYVFDTESEIFTTKDLNAFVNDKKHKGKEAKASKAFISDKYLPTVIDTVRAVQILKSMMIMPGFEAFTPILQAFKDDLEENDEAILTKTKLESVIKDFSSYNKCFGENTPTVKTYRDKAQEIITNCDVIKSVRTLDDPDPMPPQEELDEFVTVDGQDGDIPILKKAFLNFIDAHKDDFTGSEFVGLVEKVIANLNSFNNGLGDALFEPDKYKEKLKNINYEAGGDTEAYETYVDTYKKYIKGKVSNSEVYAYDPVDLNSGSFVSDKTDLVIAGPHVLEVMRSYNSQKTVSGVMGIGWTMSYEEHLEKRDDTITLFYGDGRVGCFKKVLCGKEEVYLEIHGAEGTLRETESGYRLNFDDNTYREYDSEGYLAYYGDGFGHHIFVTYDTFEKTAGGEQTVTPLPIKVTTEEGSSITFRYSKDGILTGVVDHTGREVVYGYSEENGSFRLSSITAPDGTVRKYEYTDDGMISSATRRDGVVGITNEYDAQKRVTRQVTADGNEFRYIYDDAEHVTTVVEPSGLKVEYVSDEIGRHIATRYPEYDIEDSYTYNEKGLKISHTDKRGFTTRYTYDNKGHVTGIIGTEGLRESFTYNALGKLISKKDSEGNIISYKYDLSGNLYSITDGNGGKTRYDYENGRLIAMRDAEGNKTIYKYDERGNLASITDPNGVVTRYYYDELGRIIATEDAEGNRTSFVLDVNGNILRATDPEGNETGYSYTALGKISEVVNPDGTRKQWDYNIAGRKSAYTDEENRVTQFFYNSLYQEEKVILPNNGVVSYEYDKLGYRIAQTDAEGKRTEYAYDKGGNRISTTKVSGTGDDAKRVVVSTLTYDDRGRVLSETDAEGRVTSYAYDKNSNLTEKTDAAGAVTRYEYDGAGRLIRITDPIGRQTQLTYTGDGRLKSSTDYFGVVTINIYENTRIKRIVKRAGDSELLVKEYDYDPCGRIKKQTLADGHTMEFVYDKAGRVAQKILSDGRHMTYAYDPCGRVIAYTESGNTTRYTYTGTGKIRSVTDPLGNVTEYTYNELDLLVKIDRSGDHVTDYERNLIGDIVCVTDGLGRKDVYTYDEFGRVKTVVDRAGNKTTYTRDNLGNVTGVDYSDGKSVRLQYSALNKLEEIRDHLGVTTIKNDILGRMTSVTDYKGRTVGYEYGPGNNRTAIIYPDGRVARYSYDEFGRLSTLSNMAEGEAPEAVTYTYDEIGRLSCKAFPNGTSTLYDYYPGGNIRTLTSMDSDGVIDKYEYHYTDAIRDKIKRTRRGYEAVSGTYGYAYDALGRLISTSFNGDLKTSYTYDTFGNRATMTEGDTVTEYHYDALDRLTASVVRSPKAPSVNTTYDYDESGHLILMAEDGVVRKTFDYDVAGMMVHAHDTEMGDATYEYNGMGYRVSCERPDEKTEYLCDLSGEFYNLLERYVNGQKQSFVYDRNVVSMHNESADYYYLQDELGSTMYLTGTDGKTVDSYAFDDFGRSVDPATGAKPGYTKEGNILQPFAFTGYQEDEVSGLMFAQARYYNNETGRFASEDQIRGYVQEPDTQNRYTYCHNNPIKYVDLNGKTPIDDPVADAEAAQEIQDALDDKWSVPEVFYSHTKSDQDKVEHCGTNTTPGCLTDTVSNTSGDDAQYVAAVYLLAEDGAAGQGHAAVALVKDNGEADVFSIGGGPDYDDAHGVNIQGYFGTHVDENGQQAPMDFSELMRTGNMPHDNNNNRGVNEDDKYTHFIYQPITNQEGVDMYNRAMAIRNEYISDSGNPNDYVYLNRRGDNCYDLMDNNCGQNVMLVFGDKYAFAHPYRIDNWWRSKPNVQYQDGVAQINGYTLNGYYGTIDQLRIAFCEV